MPNARRLPLLNRVKNEHLRNAADACFDLADALAARRAELNQSNKFTEQGRAAEIADALRAEFAPKLRAAQQPIVKAMQEAETRMRALSLPAPDPANLRQAIEHQEIRAMLRGMPLLDRTKLVFDTKDSRIIEAVLTAPCELSGLPADRFEVLMNKVREKLHGPAVAEIAKLQDDIDGARMCVTIATNEMKRESGIDGGEFSKIIGNQNQGAPWLRRDGDRIIVVRPGESTFPLANAQEVAMGKYYLTYQEYLDDRPEGLRPVPLHENAKPEDTPVA